MTDIVVEPRVTQTMIVPGAVKPRHLEIGTAPVKFGLSADRPTEGTVYPCYFAIDTFVFSIWTGQTWKTSTFS